MDKPKRSVGRPRTGRALARYWIYRAAIDRIAHVAEKRGLARPADLLEEIFK